MNNAWSGSCVLPTRSNTVGAYVDRCVQLHNTAGEVPDVILVFLGTNDFSYYQNTLGTYETIDFGVLITDNGDGTYTYAAPTTTCEAYAIMLHKMQTRYPDAEIYCLSLTARRSPDKEDSYADVGQPTEFNASLAAIAQKYGCTVVDLENCGIDAEANIFDTYMGDGRVHPNAQGMDKLSEAVVSAMLGADTELYDVSFDLTNVTGDGVHAVLPGSGFSAALTEAEGFRDMQITVTMGGVDVTAEYYADGTVFIPAVAGNVVIDASALERDPLNFLWEFDGSNLVSVTTEGNTENALTLLAGSATDGVFSDARYQMEQTVLLLHDRPWVVEWKGAGTGGVILAKESTPATGDPFLFRRQGNQLFAVGVYEGSQYNNYGITLPDTVDTTLPHTYRLANQIAEDGTNMVYLYVDDVQIGALNNYFVGGADRGTTSEWINGQDLLLNHIGTTTRPLTDMSVEYLQIKEDSAVHRHGYAAVVTKPTYTEGGYTTYTCSCGESFVSDYTDPIALYSYRWEMADGMLVSITTDGNTENLPTLTDGTVTDGAFAGTRYSLENTVRLYHDAPWVVEWKATGDWSAMLLTTTAQSATEGMRFLFRTYNETGLLALGTYSGGKYHNYGIALAECGLDMTQEHTYRLENRIAGDGSNMVYLIVDGTELGAMNNYYIGGTNNQNQTVDWANGRDFTFGFMGSTSHPLNNMTLEYFQVHEGGESEFPDEKTISILGASMSTYTGISNNADTNSTIGNNAVYYTEGRHGVYANDTWWMQVANDLGLRLLVNNSWSGSSLLYTRNGTVGAYVERCVQLHDDTGDNAGEEPDIIGIQMGTNDYQYFKDTLGTADISYDTLIVDNGDGTYTYAEPTTSLEAAAIVMHKISVRYPEAEVYYLNLSQRVDITDETAGILETFNENLATVCAHFGVTIVDIYNSGITQENFDTYIGDGRVHPNCFGMDAYTEAFKKALLGNHEELTAYTVDFQLNNVTVDYGVNKQVLSGKSFTCTLTAPEYFKPEVSVTMGGVDITDSCHDRSSV